MMSSRNDGRKEYTKCLEHAAATVMLKHNEFYEYLAKDDRIIRRCRNNVQ